jgi:hypothetical protein
MPRGRRLARALAAVDTAVVHVAADARLEDHLGQLALEDVVIGAPPAADVLRERLKRELDRRVHGDRCVSGCG